MATGRTFRLKGVNNALEQQFSRTSPVDRIASALAPHTVPSDASDPPSFLRPAEAQLWLSYTASVFQAKQRPAREPTEEEAGDA